MRSYKAKAFLSVCVSEGNLGETIVTSSAMGANSSWVTVSEVNVGFPVPDTDLKALAVLKLKTEVIRLKSAHAEEMKELIDAISTLEANNE